MSMSEDLALRIRQHALRMVSRSNSSHIGCCLSIADILAVLYESILNYDPYNPNKTNRDRFILSKGHAAAILYAILAEKNFFPLSWLQSYNFYGAKLLGHVTKSGVPGVELSTGSLGHGLSVGVGMAIALKRDNLDNSVYVLVGDGECNEGSIWEAALLAQQLKLNNLTVIIDNNKMQSLGFTKDVIDLGDLYEKWNSFGWHCQDVNGHNHQELYSALNKNVFINKPRAIIAHTIKGKGVSFMENNLQWHYSSPDIDQLNQALYEIEVAR